MTMLNTISATDRPAGRLETAIRDLRLRYDAWKVFRRTVNELNRLSDRELADLGLHRSSITAIAREAACGN